MEHGPNYMSQSEIKNKFMDYDMKHKQSDMMLETLTKQVEKLLNTTVKYEDFQKQMDKKASTFQVEKIITQLGGVATTASVTAQSEELNESVNKIQELLNDRYVTFEKMDGEIQRCCDELNQFFVNKDRYEEEFAETDKMLAAMRTMDKKAVNGINELNEYVEVLKNQLTKKVDSKAFDNLVEAQ